MKLIKILEKVLQRFPDRDLELRYQRKKSGVSYRKFKWCNLLVSISCLIFMGMIYMAGLIKEEIKEGFCIVQSMKYLLWMTPVCILLMQVDTLLMKYRLLGNIRGVLTLLTFQILFSELSIYQYQNIPGLSVDYAASYIIFIITLYIGQDILKYWVVAGLTIGVGNLYLFFRYYGTGKASIFYIFIHITEIAVISFVLHRYEKKERKMFRYCNIWEEKEGKWKEIIKKIPVGIVIRNKGKDIKLWNEKADEIIVEEVLEGGRLNRREKSNILEEIVGVLDERWKNRGDREKIDHQIMKEGEDIYLEINKLTLDFEGEECKMYIMKNITTIKRIQIQLENAAKEKDVFFASMSHELRNPLNALLGCIEILKTTATDSDTEIMKIAVTCGETLLNLIGNILDVSKIENQKLELTLNGDNLIECLRKVVLMFSGSAEKKGINIEFIPDSIIPKYFLFDQARLNQVLINLIGNAIKFTDQGYVKVVPSWHPQTHDGELSASFVEQLHYNDYLEFAQIATTPTNPPQVTLDDLTPIAKFDAPSIFEPFEEMDDPDYNLLTLDRLTEYDIGDERAQHLFETPAKQLPKNGYMKIHIMDTGIGISEENIRKLFLPFSQTEKSMRKFGGTGLGLFISDNIIKIMGGSIKIVSEVGIGSSFVIVLPLIRYDQTMAISRHVTSVNAIHGVKCLLVDDEDYNLRIMGELLERNGASVFLAHNGKEGLEMYKKSLELSSWDNFNLILSDLRMPIMSGQEMIREIRALEISKGDNRIPIIVLSGDPSENEKAKCISDYGADAFLNKPLKLSALQITISEIRETKLQKILNLKLVPKQITIFVIDDDIFCSQIVVKHLYKNGFTNIITAYSGKEALKQFTENIAVNKPDLTIILLDAHLPDQDGPEIATSIINASKFLIYTLNALGEENNLQIKIFGLSGDPVEEQEKFYLDAECQIYEFFQKPLQFTKFIKIIKEATISI